MLGLLIPSRRLASPFTPRRCPRCGKWRRHAFRNPNRILPQWRRYPNALNMAAGDRLLDASGNQILDDSGNVFLSDGAGDDCCCGEPSCPGLCTGSGTIAEELNVVISGVTICTGCIQSGASWYKVTSGNVDGDFCLNHEPGGGECFYDLGDIAGITIERHTTSACDSLAATFTTFAIGLSYEGSLVSVNGPGNLLFFVAAIPTSNPCKGPYTLNNALTVCGALAFGGITAGTGGTLSVSYPC